MSNGVLEPIRGMGAAGDVWGSQLSSKAPAASGRAAWGPPASCWGWVSSSEGVSVGMQERGERATTSHLSLGSFLPLHPDSPWCLCLGCCFSLKAPIVLLATHPAGNQTEPSLSYTHPQYKARFIRPMSFADSLQSVCLAASHCSRSHHPHTAAPIFRVSPSSPSPALPTWAQPPCRGFPGMPSSTSPAQQIVAIICLGEKLDLPCNLINVK